MTDNINMRDVARRAGVTAGTVSRVLSNRMGQTQVSNETRQRILDAVKELNYVPNINATRLFLQRSGVLGFVVPRHENPNIGIFTDMHLVGIFNGIERTLADSDCRILIISQDQRFIDKKEYLSIFRSKQLDGIFIWGAHRNYDFYDQLRQNNYPHVFLTTRPDCCQDTSIFFRIDYAQSSYQSMHYLLSKGYRRIVWCDSFNHTSLQTELENGISKALSEFGLDWNLSVVSAGQSGYYYNDGVALAEKILRDYQDADAILLISHDSARGCLDYLREHDKRCPEDFALACCDSLIEEPSVVKIPRAYADDFALGRNAALCLISQISGQTGEYSTKRHDSGEVNTATNKRHDSGEVNAATIKRHDSGEVNTATIKRHYSGEVDAATNLLPSIFVPGETA